MPRLSSTLYATYDWETVQISSSSPWNSSVGAVMRWRRLVSSPGLGRERPLIRVAEVLCLPGEVAAFEGHRFAIKPYIGIPQEKRFGCSQSLARTCNHHRIHPRCRCCRCQRLRLSHGGVRCHRQYPASPIRLVAEYSQPQSHRIQAFLEKRNKDGIPLGKHVPIGVPRRAGTVSPRQRHCHRGPTMRMDDKGHRVQSSPQSTESRTVLLHPQWTATRSGARKRSNLPPLTVQGRKEMPQYSAPAP